MQIKKMAVSAAIVAALGIAGVTKDKEPRCRKALAWSHGGRCNRCGHFTEASLPGVVCCKWGGCNGVVDAKPLNTAAANLGKAMGDGE